MLTIQIEKEDIQYATHKVQISLSIIHACKLNSDSAFLCNPLHLFILCQIKLIKSLYQQTNSTHFQGKIFEKRTIAIQ